MRSTNFQCFCYNIICSSRKFILNFYISNVIIIYFIFQNIAPGTVITDMLTNALGSNIDLPNFILLPEDIADAVVYALGTPIRIEVSGINYMKFQTKSNIIILKYFCKCNKYICTFCLYFYFNSVRSKFFFFLSNI